MPVSKELFRKVLGHFATGVTVVTMRHHSGKPWGLTVNSFTSVSLDPPLILVCVDRGTESHQAIAAVNYFAVNFLSERQQELSCRFASRSPERFSEVSYSDGTHGCPLITGCLGFVECRKVTSHTHGDHTIIIGEVVEAKAADGNPLLFYRGSYTRLEASLDVSEEKTRQRG